MNDLIKIRPYSEPPSSVTHFFFKSRQTESHHESKVRDIAGHIQPIDESSRDFCLCSMGPLLGNPLVVSCF